MKLFLFFFGLAFLGARRCCFSFLKKKALLASILRLLGFMRSLLCLDDKRGSAKKE